MTLAEGQLTISNQDVQNLKKVDMLNTKYLIINGNQYWHLATRFIDTIYFVFYTTPYSYALRYDIKTITDKVQLLQLRHM